MPEKIIPLKQTYLTNQANFLLQQEPSAIHSRKFNLPDSSCYRCNGSTKTHEHLFCLSIWSQFAITLLAFLTLHYYIYKFCLDLSVDIFLNKFPCILMLLISLYLENLWVILYLIERSKCWSWSCCIKNLNWARYIY